MKSLTLKTMLIAASLAATSVFGAERGLPFEVTQFNRGIVNPSENAATAQATAGSTATTSGARVATGGATLASGAWANDHNFIAPAR